MFSDDGVSGAEFKNRPSLNALLSAVKEKHRLNALIVSEQSRLGRDTIRTLALIQALNDSGVKIWSYLEDKELLLDDELGEIESFMKSWAGASGPSPSSRPSSRPWPRPAPELVADLMPAVVAQPGEAAKGDALECAAVG